VCGQTANYPDRYAGKWHKCHAGCAQYPGTRLVLVPDGWGIPEVHIESAWREAIRRGRVLRVLGGLAAVALATGPLLVPELFPRSVIILFGGMGTALACAAIHGALNHAQPKPPGL